MKSKVVREIPANPFLRDARKLKKNLRVAAVSYTHLTLPTTSRV